VGSSSANKVQFSNTSAATKAASLLGVSVDTLNSATFVISPQRMAKEDLLSAAWESLEGLASGLYSTAMAAIVSIINNTISTSTHTNTSIFLIDSPGKID
jgi:myosin heavy subunit